MINGNIKAIAKTINDTNLVSNVCTTPAPSTFLIKTNNMPAAKSIIQKMLATHHGIHIFFMLTLLFCFWVLILNISTTIQTFQILQYYLFFLLHTFLLTFLH